MCQGAWSDKSRTSYHCNIYCPPVFKKRQMAKVLMACGSLWEGGSGFQNERASLGLLRGETRNIGRVLLKGTRVPQ